MRYEKLNRLYLDYRETLDDTVFRELYEESVLLFRGPHRYRLTSSGYGDTNDADTLFDSVIWRLASRDGVDGFGRQVFVSLSNARKDFYRNQARRLRHLLFVLDSDAPEDLNKDSIYIEPASEMTLEDEFLERQKKKKANQQELIDYLLESGKIQNDPTMVAAIEGLPYYKSINALAGAMGLSRNTVDRKFRRLAQFYNASVFGDITDYLPDEVRIKREYITA